MDKRGQSLPLNTVIIAIIVLVVLVIVIAILVGGTLGVTQRIKEIFGGSVAATDISLARQFCQEYCDSEKYDAFCKKTFYLDENVDGSAEKNSDGNYIKYYCGPIHKTTLDTNINDGFIGISCPAATGKC